VGSFENLGLTKALARAMMEHAERPAGPTIPTGWSIEEIVGLLNERTEVAS
jgi:hypothetical protein